MQSAWDALVAAIEGGLSRVSPWLDRCSQTAFVLLTVGAALGLGLLFFSPRLCVLEAPMAGSYEWDRATIYLAQCAHPFAPTAEPAMRWRLLPPLAAHLLHLTGYWPLLLPWAGLILLLANLALCFERLTSSRLIAALSVTLFGTSGAVLFITMCHGINDAWYMLGLLVVASSRREGSVALACLLAPWVDERFLLGLPLALFCRAVMLQPVFAGGKWSMGRIGAAAAVYPVVRLVVSLAHPDHVSAHFVREAVRGSAHYLPFAPAGWWMGYRAGWILIILIFAYAFIIHGRRTFFLGLAATLAGWGVVTLLAADLTRSTNLLLPLFIAGTWAAVRSGGIPFASRLLLALLVANLAMPYEMMTSSKSLLLHPLPFELVRLYKNWR